MAKTEGFSERLVFVVRIISSKRYKANDGCNEFVVNEIDLNKYRNFNRSRFKPSNMKKNYSKSEQTTYVDDPMDVDTGQVDEFEEWEQDLDVKSRRAWF